MSRLLEARSIGRRAGGGIHGGKASWLLRDLSLELSVGDRVAVVGPSGAGKTLLLRALALLDPVEEGEILWQGDPVADDAVPSFRRRVIYLHQRPALVEGTVEANLRRPFSFASADRNYDPEGVRSLLASLGRDETFLGKQTTELSGGEGQIVAFLRALQLGPRVLLLDEPTAALDRDAVAALERLVQGWCEEDSRGRAFIWVSHDAEQASRMTQRALRLAAGRLVR